MKYPDKYDLQKSMLTGMACALVVLAGLSACSSSDSTPAVNPANTTTVSGKISTDANPPPDGEPGVTVKGIYSDTDPANPSTTTAADGTFTLTVDTTKAVSIQISKSGYATLNFEKTTITAPITDADEDGYPTTTMVQQVINAALAPASIALADKSWFVVQVTDALGDDLGGVSIASNPAPDVEVYVDCDGSEAVGGATVACPPGSARGVMYLAYFDAAPGDISVMAIGETQVAPVRMGEISVFDFEQ